MMSIDLTIMHQMKDINSLPEMYFLQGTEHGVNASDPSNLLKDTMIEGQLASLVTRFRFSVAHHNITCFAGTTTYHDHLRRLITEA